MVQYWDDIGKQCQIPWWYLIFTEALWLIFLLERYWENPFLRHQKDFGWFSSFFPERKNLLQVLAVYFYYLFSACFFLCKKLVDGREWSHNQQYAYNDCTYMYWQDAINNQTCLKKWNWIFWFVYNKYNKYHKYHINIIWYVYKSINKLAGFGTLGLSTAPWVNSSPWARWE